MSTNPAAINRPLTDDERSLMNRLAIVVVARETRCTADTAANVLDQHAAEGNVLLRGDAYNAYLDVCGKTIVHCARDWLAFHAEHPEAIDLQRHGDVIADEDDAP